jgi:RNA polymerase sigma-70 factor, ECF subfamily
LPRSRPSEATAEPAATAGSPERQLLDAEFTSRVARLVRTLPPKLRDPLLLMATGEWTYAEMAAALKVSEGTLKWRVIEARRRLKQKLAAVGYVVR